jgi:hypothetical protein
MMPTLMNLGTQVGNAIVMFLDDPVKYLKGVLLPEETEEEKIERQNEQVENLKEGVFGLDFLKGLTDILEKYLPEDTEFKSPIQEADATEFIGAPELEDYDPNAGDADGKFQPKDADGGSGEYDPYAGRPIPEYVGSLEHILDVLDTSQSSSGEIDEEAMEKEAGMYTVEQEEKDRAEAAAQLKKEQEQAAQKAQDAAMKKAQEDYEKKLKQQKHNERLAKILAKPAEALQTEVDEAQDERNAQQETVNTVNPKYAGTPSEGKLSRSLNAGANVGKKMAQNATRGHVNLSSSNKSNLKPETIALLKSMGVAGYAQGFDGMINSPTLFMAGESGAEHVKVTPNGQGGGGNITVNIQNMNGSDDDLRKLKKTILEVIQQSANNRGRL